MNQNAVCRAVAAATGETVTTIRELGFLLADPAEVCHDPEPCGLDAKAVDWDELDGRRISVLPQRPRRELAVA